LPGLDKLVNAGQVAVKAVAHGAIGGVTSVVRGGKFVGGFASGAFGSLAGAAAGSLGLEGAPAIAFAAVSGGVGAELGGGKFANGAVSGAFSQLGAQFKAAYSQEVGESVSGGSNNVGTQCAAVAACPAQGEPDWSYPYPPPPLIDWGGIWSGIKDMVLFRTKPAARTQPAHRGTIQIQGKGLTNKSSDIEIHRPWAQDTPLTLDQGLALLQSAGAELPNKVWNIWSNAAYRAERYMIGSAQHGGLSSGPSKSFYVGDGTDRRVDVHVMSGQAFVPMP
jgi:hypothetical protein